MVSRIAPLVGHSSTSALLGQWKQPVLAPAGCKYNCLPIILPGGQTFCVSIIATQRVYRKGFVGGRETKDEVSHPPITSAAEPTEPRQLRLGFRVLLVRLLHLHMRFTYSTTRDQAHSPGCHFLKHRIERPLTFTRPTITFTMSTDPADPADQPSEGTPPATQTQSTTEPNTNSTSNPTQQPESNPLEPTLANSPDLDTEMNTQQPPSSADPMNMGGSSDTLPGVHHLPTQEQRTTQIPAVLEPRIPQKKDASLREFLGQMDDYAPLIPDSVTDYYLTLAGLPPPPETDRRLARLLALATQKFVADVAADAYQYSRIRSTNTTSNNPLTGLGGAAGFGMNMPGPAAGDEGGGGGKGGKKDAGAAAGKSGPLGGPRAGYGAGGGNGRWTGEDGADDGGFGHGGGGVWG